MQTNEMYPSFLIKVIKNNSPDINCYIRNHGELGVMHTNLNNKWRTYEIINS